MWIIWAAAFTLAVENPLILNLLKDEAGKDKRQPFQDFMARWG